MKGIFNKLIEIANDNIKRESHKEEIYKYLNLKENDIMLFLDSTCILDDCIVEGDYLFTKERNRLGIRKNNYYIMTKYNQDYVYRGRIYLCIGDNRYVIIPFEHK